VVLDGVTHSGRLEALACREALVLAADLNVGEILIAYDCLEVVHGLQDENMDVFSHTQMEIKTMSSLRGGGGGGGE
jgi:hypothetical protein